MENYGELVKEKGSVQLRRFLMSRSESKVRPGFSRANYLYAVFVNGEPKVTNQSRKQYAVTFFAMEVEKERVAREGSELEKEMLRESGRS